jgi:hypothetical protein
MILSQSTSAPGDKRSNRRIRCGCQRRWASPLPSKINDTRQMTPRTTSQPTNLFWVMIQLLGAQPALEVTATDFEMT